MLQNLQSSVEFSMRLSTLHAFETVKNKFRSGDRHIRFFRAIIGRHREASHGFLTEVFAAPNLTLLVHVVVLEILNLTAVLESFLLRWNRQQG